MHAAINTKTAMEHATTRPNNRVCVMVAAGPQRSKSTQRIVVRITKDSETVKANSFANQTRVGDTGVRWFNIDIAWPVSSGAKATSQG